MTKMVMKRRRVPHHPPPQPDQYKILKVISRGSYGVVYKARDNRSGETVAVKEEIRGMCRSTSTEIDILKTLPRHRHIVGLKNVVMGGAGAAARVFVVMEYMKYDLLTFREALCRPFQLEEIKLLMKGILEGVKFLHDEGVMHRDIKPSNLLVSHKNSDIKICDFGLSAPFGLTAGAVSFCPRVGTRGYKAPELLRGSWRYTCAVDMWAVGCVMAEMVLDQVLFPGQADDDEQLDSIHCVINPSFNLLGMKMVMEMEMEMETDTEMDMEMEMEMEKAELTPSGIDLLERLMAYEPEKRITAAYALNHPWFHE